MFLLKPSAYRVERTTVKIATDYGRSVFAAVTIPAGTVIGDYLGTVRPPREEYHDERTVGLYTMYCNDRFNVIANPKEIGVHLINHSCAPNCDVFPYEGHMLYVATRKIFAGEEITVSYDLFCADEPRTVSCKNHACRCGSDLCTGSMHQSENHIERLHAFLKKMQGHYFTEIPVPFNTPLLALERYPNTVGDYPLYNIFASELKAPLRKSDTILPSYVTVRSLMRGTGRRLAYPALGISIFGIRNGFIIATLSQTTPGFYNVL